MPKHCFVVMSDPVPGREDEYNAWYGDRHLADVLALDGFAAAQRFAFVPTDFSAAAPHRYLALYEIEAERVEDAAAALRAALEQSGRDEAAGREPRMSRSDALAQERATWWFTAVGDRRVAAG